MSARRGLIPIIGAGARDPAVLAAILLGPVLLWTCWPVLAEMAHRWATDPRYSHGYLVPAFALYLLYDRWRRLGPVPLRPCWWGLPLLGAAAALQLAGAYSYFVWFEGLAILGYLAGVAVLLGGAPALRRAYPAIAFLLFMLPLPYRVEVAAAGSLQRLATVASTLVLQTLGLPAVASGNIIHLNEYDLGVADACSGLGILFTLTGVATGVALVVRRPLVDRVLIVLSAVPIALLVNVIRITTTGALYVTAGPKLAELVFHDLAGLLMMPLALAFLYLECLFLSHVFVPEPVPAPVPVIAGPVGAPSAPRGLR